jgi:hypothetical protein
LLGQVAISLVPEDPVGAARLGHQSLVNGIVFSLPELLSRLEKKEAELAERLLEAALVRIETEEVNALELLELARYLVGEEASPSPNNEHETDKSNQDVNSAAVVRFLNAVLTATERFVATIKPGNRDYATLQGPFSEHASVEERAASFFSALTKLLRPFERYHRSRLDEARTITEGLKRWMDPISRDHMFVFYDNGDTPESLIAEAEITRDAKSRDDLYNLAASLADQKGDYRKALSIASRIASVEDRLEVIEGVWSGQIGRAINAGQYEEALLLVREISRPERQVMQLVNIARQAAQTSHRPRASKALDGAINLLSTIRPLPTPESARELLEIARVYASVDASRGFNLMKTAIDQINLVEMMPRDADTHRRFARPVGPTDALTLFGSDSRWFESLARADYFKAIRLAARFNNQALSIAAQLAVVSKMLPTRLPEHSSQEVER